MISQKAKYALRALIALAQAGDRALLISEISEAKRIPKKFLEQILLELKRQGIVNSRRGRNGGYALLKDPSEIFFGQVIRIIDGPLAPLPCLSRTAYRRCEDCGDESACLLRRVFAVTHAATTGILDHTSILDAITGDLPGLEEEEIPPELYQAAGI